MDTSNQDRLGDVYEEDFFSWTQEQAELLRRRRFDRVDLVNLIEEVEALGRSQLSALRSSYRLIALHLLKFRYQPTHRTDSWVATVVRERGNIEDLLDDSPGLRPRRGESLARAYPRARREAGSETGLPLATFPEECPFTLADIEGHDYWP